MPEKTGRVEITTRLSKMQKLIQMHLWPNKKIFLIWPLDPGNETVKIAKSKSNQYS